MSDKYLITFHWFLILPPKNDVTFQCFQEIKEYLLKNTWNERSSLKFAYFK